MSNEKLIYEKPSLKRKQDALDFIQEFYACNSKVHGAGGLDRYLNDFEGWLTKLDNDFKTAVSDSRVPAVTYFLIRKSDNKIIGMANVRLALNDLLRKKSGHIGYSIRPSERRKGYNKINLYLALQVLQNYGVTEALLTCNKDNVASAKTMLGLGGVLQKEEFVDGEFMQFYTIDVNKSLTEYKDILK